MINAANRRFNTITGSIKTIPEPSAAPEIPPRATRPGRPQIGGNLRVESAYRPNAAVSRRMNISAKSERPSRIALRPIRSSTPRNGPLIFFPVNRKGPPGLIHRHNFDRIDIDMRRSIDDPENSFSDILRN